MRVDQIFAGRIAPAEDHVTHLEHGAAPDRGRNGRIGVGTLGPTASLVHRDGRRRHLDPERRPRRDFGAVARAHPEAGGRFFANRRSARTGVADS